MGSQSLCVAIWCRCRRLPLACGPETPSAFSRGQGAFLSSRSSTSRALRFGMLAPVLDADAVPRWEWPAPAGGRKRSAATAGAGPPSGDGPERPRMRTRPACPHGRVRGVCHARSGVRNWSTDSGPRRVDRVPRFPRQIALEIKRDRRSGNSYGLSPPDRSDRSGEPRCLPYVALTTLLNHQLGASRRGCLTALGADGGSLKHSL